ncbi:hypothetical protein NL676_034412 [Syzygium grande]|nr:hypothetical protein NL676_034412 [Syzygium grande]
MAELCSRALVALAANAELYYRAPGAMAELCNKPREAMVTATGYFVPYGYRQHHLAERCLESAEIMSERRVCTGWHCWRFGLRFVGVEEYMTWIEGEQ